MNSKAMADVDTPNDAKIRALARHDATVATIFKMAHFQGLSWESTLELLVLQLAEEKRVMQELHLEMLNNTIQPKPFKLREGRL